MTHTTITHQQFLLSMISTDAIKSVMESYQAHRQKGDSEFAAYHAALGVFLDHVRSQPFWAAARAVRMIIVQASADLDQGTDHGAAKSMAA